MTQSDTDQEWERCPGSGQRSTVEAVNLMAPCPVCGLNFKAYNNILLAHGRPKPPEPPTPAWYPDAFTRSYYTM